jgi:glycosyltransferase involved in cell wall biosynthesis
MTAGEPMASTTEPTELGSVFISSLLDEERLPFQDPPLVYGRAHYSWKLISELYSEGLVKAGMRLNHIVRPEIYQDPIAWAVLGIRLNDIHVSVKPVEHLRPLYGLRNLFVCGWEFPEFFPGNAEFSPFFDQLAVLSRADRILCWTDYTRDNLRAAGIQQAVTLSPPILPTTRYDETDVLGMPSVFLNSADISSKCDVVSFGQVINISPKSILLAVLNPFDKRKQIDKLLEGARRARVAGVDFLLVVKLVIDGKQTTIGNINEILHSHYGYRERSDSVVFCAGELDDKSMAALRARSDFHLSAPSAEGLNLPLVESALQDIPIITTRNTAMASYLGQKDAVWIDCTPETADKSVNAFAKYADFTHYPATPDAIARAICTALSLSMNERRALAERGRDAVQVRFGQSRFETDFRALAKEVLA